VHRDRDYGAALGAAFAAGMATGEFRSWGDIAGLTTVAGRTDPDPRTAGRYAELYAVYRSLYPALLDQQRAASAMIPEPGSTSTHLVAVVPMSRPSSKAATG
jgi:sugar (pentulose or hexulose) kinase